MHQPPCIFPKYHPSRIVSILPKTVAKCRIGRQSPKICLEIRRGLSEAPRVAEVVEEEEEEEVLQHPVDVDDLLLAYPLSHCHLLATLVTSQLGPNRDKHDTLTLPRWLHTRRRSETDITTRSFISKLEPPATACGIRQRRYQRTAENTG